MALTKLQSLSQVPAASKKLIDAFLEQDPGSKAINAVEANTPVYEPKSGEIIAMLEKLKDKFGDEKATLDREEVAAQAAHDSLIQSLTTQISAAKEAIDSKTAARAK